MKRINNKKNLYKSIILLAILIIGIGYAYLTSNLSISGQTEVVANTWNIHFENLNVLEGSVTASTPATIDSNTTNISYAITLSRPKEYYEFTVDVKNDGTLPGKVSISTLSGLDTISSKVIDYSIKYTNGNPVNVGDILNAGAKKTIKVRVFYKDDISASDLPSTNLNLTLTYTLQYVQSESDGPLTFVDPIQQLIDNNEDCFTKYEGQVTDEVGKTVQAKNVYFDKCEDKRNAIFAGLCWQIVRTTETGGIKMLFNGDPVGGKCESTRGNRTGLVGGFDTSGTELNSNYMYGSKFIHNTSSNNFVLIDTTTKTWSDSTYEDLVGKFTCKNDTGVCTTLYHVTSYLNDTSAYVTHYTSGSTNRGLIGTGAYNGNYKSPAMVGYMFNKVYSNKSKEIDGTYKFGSSFTYENGTYTLTGSIKNLSTVTSDNLGDSFYTCWNEEGTCSEISFIISPGQYSTYISIKDGKDKNDALNDMLWSEDVNRYNSSIKGVVDSWYNQKLLGLIDKLEDTVYCNSRELQDNLSSIHYQFRFIGDNYNISSLNCTNITDQFAVSNNKAKLAYPVGLLTSFEHINIYPSLVLGTGSWYWTSTPSSFGSSPIVRYVSNVGSYSVNNVDNAYGGIRPVISLNRTNTIMMGTGSESNPWIVRMS